MDEATEDYEPSEGVWYACGGVSVFVVGGLLLANAAEAPELFGTTGLIFTATGLYLLGVGAVARGLQLGRRSSSD